MPKAYAYIRFSSAVQQAGDSESRQLNALELFESEYDTKIERVFYDRGKSAFRGDNVRTGNFSKIIQHVESGDLSKGDYLVVESIDRITRQRLIDGVDLLQNILRKGICIYTTTDQKLYSYNDPSQDLEVLMMISLIAKRANEESEIKSRRLLSSWRSRLARAKEGNIIIKKGKSIPYGLRVENGQFIIKEDEREEIQRLFEYLLNYGINTAIKKINVNSIKKWNNGTLNKLIKSKTVIGCMATHNIRHMPDGRTKKVLSGYIEDYYPKLIEPALFYSALDAMKLRKQKNYSGRRTEQDFNIFRNHMFCRCCGGKLYYDHRGSRYKDKFYPFYKCDNVRVNNGECSANNIRFECVLGLFFRGVTAIRKIEEDLKELNNSFAASKEISSELRQMVESNNAFKPSKELAKKLEEAAEIKTKLDNIGASLEAYDYKIPAAIIRKISEFELKLDDLNRDIELLSTSTGKIEIDFSLDSIVKLFKSSEGRGRLNAFFKQNMLSFHVSHNKSTQETVMRIVKGVGDDSSQVALVSAKFPKKNILQEFKLESLQDMFSLSVRS